MNTRFKTVSAALLATPARATTYDECQAALAQLRTDTQNVTGP